LSFSAITCLNPIERPLQDAVPFFVFLIAVFIIGGVVAVVIAAAVARNKELNEVYGALARHYGGQLHSGNWMQRPSVAFDHHGNWVRVDIHSTGGKNPTHYTQVHMGWPEPGFRMEVYPEGFFNRIGKFLGMADIEIGSPAFDRDYIITSNDAGLLRETLTPAAQAAIHQLRILHGNGQIYVAVRNYELLVKKLGILDDTASLLRLTDGSLQIYTAAMQGQEKGIQFLETKTIDPLLQIGESAENVVCQVCGDVITSDVVFCRGCATPHHHDCWEYYGQCSTFGCGQHSYRRQTTKPAKRRS
jgi:hypothetical protein